MSMRTPRNKIRLTGLPGTSRVRLAYRIESGNEAVKNLLRGRASTAAGGNGAITVWNDRKGMYHVEADRFQNSVDNQTFADANNVRDWVDEWLRRIA